MRVQEEILAISFNEEETVDGKIEALEDNLKPLLKRKRDLQVGIQNDVAKLLVKRHTLVRLQDKQKKLGDELCIIMEDSDTAKKCKRTLEDM
ncbi:hypothetical protein A2U01_0057772 [Trifolium medium]|uniref:Uncharacterized protein n=1 Tax=Trifolium medium TaxID=97028 RepID=A0A392RJX9_9FABA|nr:hypothetical protein [Trifolium medium]